jgi:hypothetical protein
MLSKRTGFLHGEIFGFDYLSQRRFVHLDTETNFLSACPEYIHRPRYEHFTFGADSPAWTLGLDNSNYFVVSLIPHIHHTMITLDLLYFNDKGTKYLCNDQMSEI